MNTPEEVDPKLDDVLLFNDYLLKLSNAGVQISLDGIGEDDQLLEKLSRINSTFAMGVARGKTVPEVLESELAIPSPYRTSLLTWLYCDRSTDALDGLSESAKGRIGRDGLLRSAILQPLILIVMAYVGFLLWLIFVGPKMKAITLQIGAEPGVGLQFLEFSNKNLWIWTIGFPTLVCLAVILWFRMRSRWSSYLLPGKRSIEDSIQVANYANGMANLIEHNFSDGQAKNAIGQPAFKSKTSTPLLDWALGSQQATEDRAKALHATSNTYRQLAQSRAVRLENWFPFVVGALVGGAVVFAYGLSLFEPLIELLTSLTQF